MAVIFLTCIFCDRNFSGAPEPVISEETSIGHVAGAVCRHCVERINRIAREGKQPTEEGNNQ
jgi:hypothetical protein